MTRAYLRLDPHFDERKYAYPDGAYRALVATLCLAETQSTRGHFRDLAYLRALLGKCGRWAKYLLDHGDLVQLTDGRLYVDGWAEWQEGDHTVGERVTRIRNRTHHVTPAVTVPVTVDVTVENPGRNGAGNGLPLKPVAEALALSVSGSTPTTPKSGRRPTAGESREKQPRLTKAQLAAWGMFTEPAWQPFKAAWLARGFLHPPFGDATDDEGTSQRARLWRIAADQPRALSRWIAEAPGKTAHDVIAYVFAQRAKVAAEVGLEEEELAEATARRNGSAVPLKDLLPDWLAGSAK